MVVRQAANNNGANHRRGRLASRAIERVCRTVIVMLARMKNVNVARTEKGKKIAQETGRIGGGSSVGRHGRHGGRRHGQAGRQAGGWQAEP